MASRSSVFTTIIVIETLLLLGASDISLSGWNVHPPRRILSGK